MTVRFVDAENLAGSFTLGGLRAGMELESVVRLPGAFGLENLMWNRGKFGMERWTGMPVVGRMDSEWGAEADRLRNAAWRESDPLVVTGTPPCSGFSIMTPTPGTANRAAGRVNGVDAEINWCMREVAAFSGRCVADVAVFESVQRAYTVGRVLMQDLRAVAEREASEALGREVRYGLWHVLHSAASVGGAQRRHRYYWLIAREGLEFGVETPRLGRGEGHVTLLGEKIGDLGDRKVGEYADKAGLAEAWSSDGLTGHAIRLTPGVRKAKGLEPWWPKRLPGGGRDGAGWQDAAKMAIAALDAGELAEDRSPDGWGSWDEVRIFAENKKLYQGRQFWRMDPTRLSPTVTGAGGSGLWHWEHDRPLTPRECFRLMGFPDEWELPPVGMERAWLWSGKQMCVETAWWVSAWAVKALEGSGGKYRGGLMEDGDRERVVDVTSDYRRVYNPRTGEAVDSRNKQWVKFMEEREGL